MAEDRKLLLSFDDGPELTDSLRQILGVLAANRIKAEFYVLGSEVERSGVAAAQIVAQGHKIQNHSWKHDQNWDVDTEDWKTPRGIGPAKLDNIKRQLASTNLKGKAILNVLMHVQKETAADLQSFIDFLKQPGFSFANP